MALVTLIFAALAGIGSVVRCYQTSVGESPKSTRLCEGCFLEPLSGRPQ
jgi:hypothetical protein